VSIIEKRPSRATAPAFALVMEADLDLRAMIRAALLLDGHRVECVPDCAGVLAWRDNVGPVPDEFILGLGAGDLDPEWETLKLALDDDAMLSHAAVIVLLTIRNGLSFPARARILQKPFAVEELLTLVASDMAATPRLPV
jgi:DNA-binding response OmpR family regulator